MDASDLHARLYALGLEDEDVEALADAAALAINETETLASTRLVEVRVDPVRGDDLFFKVRYADEELRDSLPDNDRAIYFRNVGEDLYHFLTWLMDADGADHDALGEAERLLFDEVDRAAFHHSHLKAYLDGIGDPYTFEPNGIDSMGSVRVSLRAARALLLKRDFGPV